MTIHLLMWKASCGHVPNRSMSIRSMVAWCAARLVPLDGLFGLFAKGVAAAFAASAVMLALFRADAKSMLGILRKGRRA